jgi:hypothetical protein
VTDSFLVGRGLPVDQPGPGRAKAAARRQRGMVTVEIAFASLGAAAALVLLAWALTLVMLLATCNDVATAVARQEARGDQAAVAKLLQAKPAGAKVGIRHKLEQITVTVDLTAQPWAQWLPSVPLSASATVVREPT